MLCIVDNLAILRCFLLKNRKKVTQAYSESAHWINNGQRSSTIIVNVNSVYTGKNSKKNVSINEK